MGVLPNPRWEAFARALARGLTRYAAARDAGYASCGGFHYGLAKRPVITDRVAILAKTLRWSGDSDLTPVIDALVDLLALRGAEPVTAADRKVSLDILREIANLKQRLPPPPPPTAARTAALPPLPFTLSPEEWSRQCPSPA